MIYDKKDEANCEDAFIVYDENEKDSVNYEVVASNTGLLYLVHTYAPDGASDNPEAYVDEDELVCWD